MPSFIVPGIEQLIGNVDLSSSYPCPQMSQLSCRQCRREFSIRCEICDGDQTTK